MSVAATTMPPAGTPRRARATAKRGHAFGIEIAAPFSLPLASGAPGDVGDRAVVLEQVEADVLERCWQPRLATTVLERRFRDGRLVMSVQHVPDVGYRVYAPRVGRHLISPDGRRIRSALPPLRPWRWQRLLFAQVLPLAATLQGLELLHASAVELEGRTVAFVAPSGTGKTSVAAHLVAGGASLLTDDVLAFESRGGGVIGYPGVRNIAVSDHELDAMSQLGRARLGGLAGRGDKTILEPAVLVRPRRLDAIAFLVRSATGREVGIERLAPAPLRLLASSFNTYVDSQTRVVNQLGAYATLAESVQLFEVSIPPCRSASEAAKSIQLLVEERL